jgi:DNA-binding transcriptional LysR family regulator
MRSLVANGFGYSVANIRPVTDTAPDGKRLRYIPLDGPVRPMWLGLVLAEGAGVSLTIKAFVEHCQKHITAGSTPGLQMLDPTA